MRKSDWVKVLIAAGLFYWLFRKPKRETIPTWGDSSNTG